MKTTEIEQMIEEILFMKKENVIREKRPRGRARKEKPPIWSLEFYNPSKNTSFALISMCIKENPDQSLSELALRLSAYKSRPPRECLTVLGRLEECGKLGYYDENRIFRAWKSEEARNGLENLCG